MKRRLDLGKLQARCVEFHHDAVARRSDLYALYPVDRISPDDPVEERVVERSLYSKVLLNFGHAKTGLYPMIQGTRAVAQTGICPNRLFDKFPRLRYRVRKRAPKR
jgi:hypothetical protein